MLAVTALHAVTAEEILFVDWDGSGTESQQSLSTEGVLTKVSDDAFSFVFDEEACWRPLEGYNPPPEKTGDFGLAISSSSGRGPAAPQILRLDKRTTGGTLTVLVQGSETDPPQMRGVLFFTKSHFLSGAGESSAQVRFDAASRLDFVGILDGLAPEARWLVRDGEEWFVSEGTLAPQLAYNASEQRELTDPGSKRWTAYNVQGAPLEIISTRFEQRIFSNITAVGIYWDSYGSSNVVGGTSISRMAVDVFTAQGSK
jgi:hypothetical protein